MSSPLYRFAKILEVKYLTKQAVDAETMRTQIVEHIKQMLANASTVRSSGIMPFVQMATQDQVTVTLTIVKDGKSINVENITVSKPELANKYQPLTTQVKNYLEKNWELFPYKSSGDSVDYDNFKFQLSYENALQVAGSFKYASEHVCPECNGSGTMEIKSFDVIPGKPSTGTTSKIPCLTCKGAGVIDDKKLHEFKLMKEYDRKQQEKKKIHKTKSPEEKEFQNAFQDSFRNMLKNLK